MQLSPVGHGGSSASNARVEGQWYSVASWYYSPENKHAVDGRNPANQLRLVVYPIIYDGNLHHPRWLFGISEPSTVSPEIRPGPKRKFHLPNINFQGLLLVSGRAF